MKEIEIIDKNELINFLLEKLVLCEGCTDIDCPSCMIDVVKNSPNIDFNTPMKMIEEKWNPSKCPRCYSDFSEYEECDDGYYNRAVGFERCPYCGQKISWES